MGAWDCTSHLVLLIGLNKLGLIRRDNARCKWQWFGKAGGMVLEEGDTYRSNAEPDCMPKCVKWPHMRILLPRICEMKWKILTWPQCLSDHLWLANEVVVWLGQAWPTLSWISFGLQVQSLLRVTLIHTSHKYCQISHLGTAWLAVFLITTIGWFSKLII